MKHIRPHREHVKDYLINADYHRHKWSPSLRRVQPKPIKNDPLYDPSQVHSPDQVVLLKPHFRPPPKPKPEETGPLIPLHFK